MSPKSDIRDAVAAAQRQALAAVRSRQAEAHRTSELNDETINDPSEIAQSSVELAMSGDLSAPINRLSDALAVLGELDLSPHATVTSGALVRVGEDRYFISVAAEEVEVDGVTIQPIASDTPMAQAMAGKGPGDGFSVNGHSYVIDAVD